MSVSSQASEGVGFIDGQYCPINELSIPVFDMGFQLSDMCYDAIHVYKGSFFRLNDHLDRWDRAIGERRYDTLEYTRIETEEVLHECVSRAGLSDAMVYLIATRGTPPDGFKDLRNCKNRLIAWAKPYYAVVTEEELQTGCDIIVSQTVRIPPEAVDPTVKNFGRLDFVRALFEAYDKNADYAVLLDGEGNVTEGRGWNIFMLKGGQLVSPDSGVLQGITCRTVIELSEKLNIEGKLGKFKANELHAADEIFLTSTAGGVMPVRSLDGKAVGDGAPGPVTKRLTELYWDAHSDREYATPVKSSSPH